VVTPLFARCRAPAPPATLLMNGAGEWTSRELDAAKDNSPAVVGKVLGEAG
jgi:hypothetical protein